MSTYTIDHDGTDGRVRVHFLADNGMTAARLFDSVESARRWIDFMESLEPEGE